MASFDSSFNAEGQTVVAFETVDDGPRAYGVRVHSNDTCGVYGESMEHPPAVREAPPRTGVYGQGDRIGVIGKSTQPGDVAAPSSGVGVVAYGETNRAAVFQSGSVDEGPLKNVLQTAAERPAQVRIVPYSDDPRILPERGLAGDFFVCSNSDITFLWFCIRGDGVHDALWARVSFSEERLGGLPAL